MSEKEHLLKGPDGNITHFSPAARERLQREVQAYATALIGEAQRLESRDRSSNAEAEVVEIHVEEAKWIVTRRWRRGGKKSLSLLGVGKGIGLTLIGAGVALLLSAPKLFEHDWGTVVTLAGLVILSVSVVWELQIQNE